MKVSLDSLLKEGFKEYKSQFDHDCRCFQKRVKDEKGTKYFINCKYRDWSNFQHVNHVLSPSFEFDTQFTRNSDTFNVLLLNRGDRTIQEVEQFFEDMFQKMEVEYYEAVYI